MKPETELNVKFGGWGIVAGAGIAMIIGFNWGGWTTSSTAQKMTEEAILVNRAAICVAQFMNAPDHERNVKEFEATASYMRSGYIQKGGWDRMPGEDKASWKVSSPCAAAIEVVLEMAKGPNTPAS